MPSAAQDLWGEKGLLASAPLFVLPQHLCQPLTWPWSAAELGPAVTQQAQDPEEGMSSAQGCRWVAQASWSWLHYLSDRWCSRYRSQIIFLKCDLFSVFEVLMRTFLNDRDAGQLQNGIIQRKFSSQG